MTAALPRLHTDNVPLGILMMLGSIATFSVMNVMIKTVADSFPVNQVVFFRNVFALLPVVAMVMAQGGLVTLRTARPFNHAWRTVIGLTSMALMFWSLELLPLADATALNFAAPLFLTALSVPLLGEKVGVHRWSAVGVGLVGVLIMARPSGEVLNLGALVALGAAFCQALAMVAIRQLTSTEHPNTTVFYFTFFSTLIVAASLPFSWVSPANPVDLALLCGCGLIGGVGQLLLTRAYSLAPAAVVAPFTYASILFATLFGWMLWGDVPTTPVVVGAAIVIASGLYILYRETVRRKAVVAAPPAGTAD